MGRRRIRDRWASLVTEGGNSVSEGLDRLSSEDIVGIIQDEDLLALKAARSSGREIAFAAELFASAISSGGTVYYIGAGTSGRLGVIDAAELPPTFSLPFNRAIGIIAGGARAIRRSVEGAEDDSEAGRDAIRKAGVGARDLVMGISASSLAPFVRAGLTEAGRRKARTVLVTMNRLDKPPRLDCLIECVVGPEVISGSTRMKAGLATKSILHAISTTAMVLLGKTWGNRMVDLRPWCAKLEARAVRIIREASGLSAGRARKLLDEAGNDTKTAIVMGIKGCGVSEAKRLLDGSDGSLRRILGPPPWE